MNPISEGHCPFLKVRSLHALRRSTTPATETMWYNIESDSDTDPFPEMAPKQKGGQKPKANTADEVEETFQAVVCFAVAQIAQPTPSQLLRSFEFN